MSTFFVSLDTVIPVRAKTEGEAIEKAKRVLRQMLEENDPDLEFVAEAED